MRFDFHWTTDGWRISEVNADVPGGFTESSSFTQLIARHLPDHAPTGDPATDWAQCINDAAGPRGRIGLIWAAGFMEDYQIVTYLSRRLKALGHECHLAGPQQLRWRADRPHAMTADGDTALDLIVRFYQAEWLARLPRRSGWHHFFSPDTQTPLLQPGSCILVESKRLPLVWDELSTPMPAWRRLLPRTADPRTVNWRRGDEWILKTAYCNNGDSVSIRALLKPRQWRRTMLDVMLHPRDWLAQRRFETVALPTPRGPMHPCMGVFVVDGRAAGIYGRLSAEPVVNYQAVDVAVLAPREDLP